MNEAIQDSAQRYLAAIQAKDRAANAVNRTLRKELRYEPLVEKSCQKH
jgi:hypothetical protein